MLDHGCASNIYSRLDSVPILTELAPGDLSEKYELDSEYRGIEVQA